MLDISILLLGLSASSSLASVWRGQQIVQGVRMVSS